MPAAIYPFTRFVYPGRQKHLRAYARLPLRITNPHTRQTLVALGIGRYGGGLDAAAGGTGLRERLNLQRESSQAKPCLVQQVRRILAT